MLLCHRDSMMPLGIFRYPKAGLGPAGTQTQNDTPVTMFTIPSGKHLHNYGKSPFSMGKSTISMAIFNSYFDITRG